jgi:hypothetical protein
MEFEKNKPTTQRDIVLANAARVTLQPFHKDIHAEAVSNDYMSSHDVHADGEATDPTDQSGASTGVRHQKFAAIVTMFVSVLLAAALYWLFLQR